MKKKVSTVLLVSLLCVSMLAGCSSNDSQDSGQTAPEANETSQSEPVEPAIGDAEFNMISGTVLADTHPYGLAMIKLDELLVEKTDGGVTLDNFNNSQLGNERDLIEGLQLGTIQMTCVSTAPLSGFTDMFLVFDLPFLFETTEIAHAVMDSDIGTEILHSMTDQGLIGLAWFENGFRNVTNSSHPIEKPEDLQGLKIRTMENQIHMAAFQILGADPTPMAMGEVFTALQQKTIDAQENPVPIIDTNKFDEVQAYLSMTGHLYSATPVFISKAYYDTMPAEYQAAVLEATNEAAMYEREQIAIQNRDGLVALQERGMQVNTPNLSLFQAATAPIYEEYVADEVGKVSPEIYARVLEVIEAAK